MSNHGAQHAPEIRRRYLTRGRALAACAVAFLLSGAFALIPRPAEVVEQPHVAGLGDPETLASSYEVWLRNYTPYTGDGDVLVLGLTSAKGLAAAPSSALGGLRVDLSNGLLDVTVRGLPEEKSWQLWLVDNLGTEYVDGKGSVRPEVGFDDFRLVGTLEQSEGEARLETQLDLDELAGFDLDVVVVASADAADVGREGLLFGLPSHFQRIYHEQRAPGFGPHDDLPLPGQELLLQRAAFLPLLVPPLMPPSLVGEGEDLFFEEEFNGNGRTCGTCHPASNNFTLDPPFISHLPDDDPLFVAENVPALADLENPTLMRQLALILENVDGFDRPGVMRGVQHILALGLTRNAPPGGFDGSTVPPLERMGGAATARRAAARCARSRSARSCSTCRAGSTASRTSTSACRPSTSSTPWRHSSSRSAASATPT